MRHAVRIAALATISSALLALSACGAQPIGLAQSDPFYKGAEIFSQRCAGCHSLKIAGTQGSSASAMDKEITDGPNFNQRKESEANVLYALRNGGFSNKIMPQNIVTGAEAEEVARFLSKYAGADAKNPVGPKPATVDPGSDEPTAPGQPAPGTPEGGGTSEVSISDKSETMGSEESASESGAGSDTDSAQTSLETTP